MLKLPTTPVIRALALKKASIFKLLVILTAILAWVISLGAASTQLLHQLYSSWNLTQSTTLTVYLPPESDPATLSQLQQSLPTLAGVSQVNILSGNQLQQYMQPLLSNPATLPLPTVLTVALSEGADTTPITIHINQSFPTAEVDNHQSTVTQVQQAVSGLQTAILTLGLIMLAILTLIIVLTVRTGLAIQQPTLHLLIQLGATDATLTRAITSQITGRTLAGTLAGTGLAAMAIASLHLLSPTLAAQLSLTTWATLLLTPLLLPVVAATTGALTTIRMLHKL